jgi:hypothetical protein
MGGAMGSPVARLILLAADECLSLESQIESFALHTEADSVAMTLLWGNMGEKVK